MKRILRRLRGMLGLGAIWAVVWTPIGASVFVIQYMAVGLGFPPMDLLVAILLSGTKNGFIAGFLFGGGLGLAFRSRTFADLRPARFGVIGAIAGMILPVAAITTSASMGYVALPASAIALAVGFAGALGAVTAIGSLKVAQSTAGKIEPVERAVSSSPGA